MGNLFELCAIVKGSVQGVGFRATVKYYAEQLKLSGYVRNLPDGNVEIYAQGDKPLLQKLLDKLRQEFSSYIQDISCDFHPASQIYSDFKIVRSKQK
jgi:acylphosphatase